MAFSPSAVREIARDDPAIPLAVRNAWPGAIPAIFVRGQYPFTSPALAIIGTTSPVPVARAWAFQLGREAARMGWVVISGLARGIDAAAHEGAIAGGGVTVAVVANGPDSVYPQEHSPLAARILGCGGAIISISPPGAPVTRDRLLLRNQLTSALSRAVVAVQARGRGGTLATMRHAVRQGRFLAACTLPPDSVETDWAGNSLLLSPSSPWRDRDLDWQPAHPLTIPTDLTSFFSVLAALPEHVDVSPRVQETHNELQPRLLEQRAQYRIAAPSGPSDTAAAYSVKGNDDDECRSG